MRSPTDGRKDWGGLRVKPAMAAGHLGCLLVADRRTGRGLAPAACRNYSRHHRMHTVYRMDAHDYDAEPTLCIIFPLLEHRNNTTLTLAKAVVQAISAPQDFNRFFHKFVKNYCILFRNMVIFHPAAPIPRDFYPPKTPISGNGQARN